MVSRIFDILQSIGIVGYHLECTSKTDEYAVYSIYQEKDIEVADNVSQATIYYVTINYWYNRDNRLLADRYKAIKNVMKTNKFTFDGCVDLVGETHFGKNIDFKIKVWNEDSN